jgi:hypothetical protein
MHIFFSSPAAPYPSSGFQDREPKATRRNQLDAGDAASNFRPLSRHFFERRGNVFVATEICSRSAKTPA